MQGLQACKYSRKWRFGTGWHTHNSELTDDVYKIPLKTEKKLSSQLTAIILKMEAVYSTDILVLTWNHNTAYGSIV